MFPAGVSFEILRRVHDAIRLWQLSELMTGVEFADCTLRLNAR